MQGNLPTPHHQHTHKHTPFLPPFLSLSLSSLSPSPSIALLFITWNLCRGINNNSQLYLLVDSVKQRQEKEGDRERGRERERTAVACLPRWEKIATVTEGVIERWKRSWGSWGGWNVRWEKCGERERVGNIKRDIVWGKDERRQKTRERKRGSDGRVGVLPLLLSALHTSACPVLWIFDSEGYRAGNSSWLPCQSEEKSEEMSSKAKWNKHTKQVGKRRQGWMTDAI